MIPQVDAAKAGAKIAWAGVKLIGFILGIAGLCTVLWITSARIATLQAENASLTEFKQDTLKKDEVSAAASASFARAQQSDVDRSAAQDETYNTHHEATRAAANEDAPTADFLNAPIPARLRRADREARAAARRDGGLAEGEGARRRAD